MSMVASIWLASILGALLFFVAGYLTGRRPAAEARAPKFPEISKPILNDNLDAILSALALSEGMCAVAVSDEQGLPLCGTGEHVEGLAALSGLLGEIEQRAKRLLPINSVRRITVETDRDATVSTCPLSGGALRIALTTLTTGPGPDLRRFDEVLNRVAAAIARDRAN